MKRVLAISALLLIIYIGISMAGGPVPWVGVIFSSGEMQADCPDAPPGTVVDSLYVFAVNLECWLSSIVYMIDYPPVILVLGEDTGTLVCIGNSWTCITCSTPLPQNAFQPVQLNKVTFIWNCQGCPVTDIAVIVRSCDMSSCVRYGCSGDPSIKCAVGMTSLICSTLPVETSSWGRIKSLYHSSE